MSLAGFVAAFLAVLFTLVGSLKLIGVPAAVTEFTQIGFGQWFRYVTGILEVTGAIGLLIPLRFWAALQIGAVMAGATAINIWVLHVPGLARVTVCLMAMALLLAWLRPHQKGQA